MKRLFCNFGHKSYSLILITLLFTFAGYHAKAQLITTYIGTGTAAYTGDGGAASAATINGPGGMWVDASGNIYIADANNNVIRKVNTSGVISTIAGTGTAGFSGDGGAATAAQLNHPICVVVDATGNVYFSDGNNNRVRVIISGLITTICGNGTASSTGDGAAATAATVNYPYGVALDAAGNLYICEGTAACCVPGIFNVLTCYSYAGSCHAHLDTGWSTDRF